MAKGALSRFTVLDLSRVRAGPVSTRQLADCGANVIKVESPQEDNLSGPRDGFDFQNLNRNKRSMILDLKQSAGRDVFMRMVKQADVVVENYRPDVKHRLSVDYERVKKINPKIVYASVSGFGQDGPYAQRPGVDQIAQGMGGLMSITGLPNQGPVRVGIPITDLCAGLYCAFGILAALHEREVSGEGQWIQTSLLQAQIAMLDLQAARYLVDGVVPQQAGNHHPTSIPMGMFSTKDKPINIGASGGDLFNRLCDAIERPELVKDPRFGTEQACSENRDSLNALLESIFVTKSAEHWIERLNQFGVPCGPVNTIDETFADPQVRHLDTTLTVNHPQRGEIDLVGQPIKMSRTPTNLNQPAPSRGMHTQEVLQEFGFSQQDIEKLSMQGVLGKSLLEFSLSS
ncbi:MAG: CoA transferase [Gammaproteobacteria bacterium]|nr:CoA transferase [Gammaproteobacteria bacterium]